MNDLPNCRDIGLMLLSAAILAGISFTLESTSGDKAHISITKPTNGDSEK